jgi:PPOX class probable F420-dependent enzyme
MPESVTGVTVPASHRDLLEQPLYGHLATIRPDGGVQVNPMWFEYDGQAVRFTHTTKRQKYRNLAANPVCAMSVCDPGNPSRYLEVRGVLDQVVPDPTGEFFRHLSIRYGSGDWIPDDAADRVVLVMRLTGFSTQ